MLAKLRVSRWPAASSAIWRADRAGEALLITALAVLVFVVVDFSIGERRYSRLSEQSDHARSTIDAANSALSALTDAETGQRGFLITLKPAYLDPYRSGVQAWAPSIDELKSRTRDTPRLHDLAQQFSDAGTAKLTHLAQTIVDAQRGSTSNALAGVESGLGKQIMDKARRIQAEIVKLEEVEYSRLERLAMQTESQIRWSVEAAAAALFLLTLAGTILLQREIVKERALAEDLEKSQRKYRDLAESLEHQVEERTRELERVNEELQAFSWSVSHDLRAPLRAIDGFSAMLLEDHAESLGRAGRDLLDRIRAGVTRMTELVHSLLELSRVTRAELNKQRISISELALSITEGLRHASPERAVHVNIQPGLTAEGDPSLVRVLLENLLSNAWKFTSRKDEARIEVGAVSCEGGHEFFVRDNGSGFDMAYAAKLFKPFQRLHSASEFEGTGVGLATAERVVRRHGGAMRAESNTGEGAVFYFTL